MAKLDRERPASGPIVQGFVGRGFRVGEATYETGLMLTPETALAWHAPSIEALAPADLAPLLALSPPPEFILLGTGATLRRPAVALIAAVEASGAGVEPMDSRAAARAWGVLRAEGRWIAAALLPF